MTKENDITKTTNLEETNLEETNLKETNLKRAIFINDVTLYNAQDNDNHPNIINESNISEKYLDYAKRDKINNILNNNFCFYLNGLSENDISYEVIRQEALSLKFHCKGIDFSYLSDFINNKNKEVKIPDNSDITVIVAAHGGQDENKNVLISDNLHQKHKPQDIIKKIRETLEHNIQDKDKDILRDINIKFHACYGLLITQNIDAIQELKKLNKAFPNSRVNLITEKFGAINYGDECLLNKMGNLYPTKVFLDGETHPRIFLTAEEIKQSKEHLFELFERQNKNNTLQNFISQNQTHIYVRRYDPDEAYKRYNEDLVNKFNGHLIHLGLSIEDIRQFSNEFKEFSKEQKRTNINSSALDRQKKFTSNYNFPAEQRTNSFDDEFEKLEAFNQKLKKHEEDKKLLWSQVFFVTEPSISFLSIFPPLPISPPPSISPPPILPDSDTPSSEFKFKPTIFFPPIPPNSDTPSIEKNSKLDIKSNDTNDLIDNQKLELLGRNYNSYTKSNISKRSNSTTISTRSKYLSKPASNSSFVEKLKKEREERSKSQPNSKGRSL